MAGDQRKRVFVSNLAYSVRWWALKDFMRQAGNVQYVQVRSLPDGRSQGCGVVEYASVEEAKRAIDELNDKELQGRPVFVREDREPSIPSGPRPGRRANAAQGSIQGNALPGRLPRVSLLVSNLAPETDWRGLKDLVRGMGVQPLRADVNSSRGEGTIVVRNASLADAVLSALQGVQFHGNPITVKPLGLSDNQKQDGPSRSEAPAESKQLAVFNLPWSTTSDELVRLFGQAAPVVGAEVLFKGGRSKGQGVVEFMSVEEATTAKGRFHLFNFLERPIRVEFNPRWRRLTPQPGAEVATP